MKEEKSGTPVEELQLNFEVTTAGNLLETYTLRDLPSLKHNSNHLMEEILHQLLRENIPLFTGFYTSQVVVWDVFHQQ